MPASNTMDAVFPDGHEMKNIRLTVGMDYPKERRWTDGWGVSIEVPAVIELLARVQAGTLSIEDLRSFLATQANEIAVDYDPREADPIQRETNRCAGDCDRCQAKRPEFDRLHQEALEQKAKFDQPGVYPYTVSRSSVHLTTCPEVTRSLGAIKQFPNSFWTVESALRHFTHEGAMTSSWAAHYWPMARHEAASWTAEHTGPKGGKQYRLCKICNPEHP
ncbi:hypothetical protein AB0O76_36955 [Streptomyces sp. NPDC086554]|uniref:hypothetical protein n=1 Tax=Streptomyces sp. NPDC086554 TaxID=3154864 RepID=UPI003439FE29